MHTDVDLIEVFMTGKIFIEVFHMLEQKYPIALEILSFLFRFITHVNHDCVAAPAYILSVGKECAQACGRQMTGWRYAFVRILRGQRVGCGWFL